MKMMNYFRNSLIFKLLLPPPHFGAVTSALIYLIQAPPCGGFALPQQLNPTHTLRAAGHIAVYLIQKILSCWIPTVRENAGDHFS